MASEILRNLFQQANGLAFTSTKDHPMLNINQKYQLKKKARNGSCGFMVRLFRDSLTGVYAC